MQYYIPITIAQTLGVILLAAAGVGLGVWFSRLKRPWWAVGYAAPMVVIVLIGVSRWVPRVELYPPFRWIMAQRTEFALIGILCTTLFTSTLSRLSTRRVRVLVGVFMAVFVVYFAAMPFLAPAFAYSELSQLETRIDADGVCHQGTDYNCGPAAAVTALRRLGVEAEEGELALEARSTRFAGTPTDSLCGAIESLYGVPCRTLYTHNIDALRGREPAIAVVKYNPVLDHYVTVLKVGDGEIVIGDPLEGRREWTREEFERRWRGCAIIPGKER